MLSPPTDVWAAGDTYLDRHIIRLPVDAPAGEYQLEVGLYDGQTGERAPVLGVDGAALGDRLVLPGLTIR